MKGEVEIYQDEDGTFVVMDWSAYRDSGGIVGRFQTRIEAIRFARRHGREYNREFVSAEIIHLPGSDR